MKTIKINKKKILFDPEEEVEDVIQDLIDFSTDVGTDLDNLFSPTPKVTENLIDRKFNTIDVLKRKIIKMYRLKNRQLVSKGS